MKNKIICTLDDIILEWCENKHFRVTYLEVVELRDIILKQYIRKLEEK